jgi:hypothetical protein
MLTVESPPQLVENGQARGVKQEPAKASPVSVYSAAVSPSVTSHACEVGSLRWGSGMLRNRRVRSTSFFDLWRPDQWSLQLGR